MSNYGHSKSYYTLPLCIKSGGNHPNRQCFKPKEKKLCVPYAEKNTLQTTEDAKFLKQYKLEKSRRFLGKLSLSLSPVYLLWKMKETINSLAYNLRPNERFTLQLRNKGNNVTSNIEPKLNTNVQVSPPRNRDIKSSPREIDWTHWTKQQNIKPIVKTHWENFQGSVIFSE